MGENTYKSVFHYIEQSIEPVSPHELSRETRKSRVSVHMALKKLLVNGDIEKHGLSPRVFYTLKGIPETVPVELSPENIRKLVEPILKKYPVTYAGILGTITHTDSGDGLNMMISFNQPFSMIALAGIERALSQALGVKIDLITDQGANKYIKSSMMNSLTIVYGSL